MSREFKLYVREGETNCRNTLNKIAAMKNGIGLLVAKFDVDKILQGYSQRSLPRPAWLQHAPTLYVRYANGREESFAGESKIINYLNSVPRTEVELLLQQIQLQQQQQQQMQMQMMQQQQQQQQMAQQNGVEQIDHPPLFLGTQAPGQIEQAIRQGMSPAAMAQTYGMPNGMMSGMNGQVSNNPVQQPPLTQQPVMQQYTAQSHVAQRSINPAAGQFQQPAMQMPSAAPSAAMPFDSQVPQFPSVSTAPTSMPAPGPSMPAPGSAMTSPFVQHSPATITVASDLKSPFYSKTDSTTGVGNLAFCNLTTGTARKLQSHAFESSSNNGNASIAPETSMSRLGSAYVSQKEQDALRAQQNMTPQQYQHQVAQAQMNQQYQQIQQQVQGIPPHLVKQMNLPFQGSGGQ